MENRNAARTQRTGTGLVKLKTFGLGVIITMSTLLSAQAMARAEVGQSWGTYENGAYNYYGEWVRYFAFSFTGNFTYAECVSAARQARDKVEERNLTMRAHTSLEGVRLANNYRYLIFGFYNRDQGKLTWACLNVSESGRSVGYFRSNNSTYNQSTRWNRKTYNSNGKRIRLAFLAQANHGDIHFYTVTE